jgi:hypothetical protein
MKKIVLILNFFFLIALCGCTAQSLEDAKRIEEAQSYVNHYEYETDSEGSVIIPYYSEKTTIASEPEKATEKNEELKYKDGTLNYIKMNETYKYGSCEYTVLEAVASSYRDYGYQLLDEQYVDAVKGELEKLPFMFDESGKMLDSDNRLLWIKVHVKYNGEQACELNMKTGIICKNKDGELYTNGGLLRIDKETVLTGSSKDNVALKIAVTQNEETDVWLVCDLYGFDSSQTYYLKGSFGNVYSDEHYSGYLVELAVKDEG